MTLKGVKRNVVNSILGLFLVFGVLGFLMWNWPRAKIFMGDVGSTMLGFTLFILGIYYNNNQEFHFINWILIASLFWFVGLVTEHTNLRKRFNTTQ